MCCSVEALEDFPPQHMAVVLPMWASQKHLILFRSLLFVAEPPHFLAFPFQGGMSRARFSAAEANVSLTCIVSL